MKSIGLVLLLIGGLCTEVVQAQSLSDLQRASGVAYYRFADPSDITIEVKVWGVVSNPGLYEVRQGINLSTLLSLAGGPQAGARTTSTDHRFVIRVMRPAANGSDFTTVAETTMDNAVGVLNEDPVLLQGDLVVAEEEIRQRFNWRDGISILTAVGTVALIIERVARISE